MYQQYLYDDELVELTGYVQHAAQERWLTANGYEYSVRIDGRPNVSPAEVYEKQGLFKLAESVRSATPNFDWLDNFGS